MILTSTPIVDTQFMRETIAGLQAQPKRMHAKYFYDESGDFIFQQIMDMEEYYLTDAEMDILKNQTMQIIDAIGHDEPFDLIELGAGDATKSIHLLRGLIEQERSFTYYPIDISSHVINDLNTRLRHELPGLEFRGLNGDYFDMLQQANLISNRRKVVLFMGANIGNMEIGEARSFCTKVKDLLSKDDMLMIGFDLKKNPARILAAYNDRHGITRNFNLNLLKRMNRELDADFDVSSFEHYASYNPENGECKSYLISLKNQYVNLGNCVFHFSKDEYIYMEISQKYALQDIETLALGAGFEVSHYFFDTKRDFVDVVWKLKH